MKRSVLLMMCCCVVPVASAAGSNLFNPDISLILQGRFVDVNAVQRQISGFQLPGERQDSQRGFSLDHTELSFQANIDPNFTGFANFALADDELVVEEAWFQTLALGSGLTVRGGRFLSQVGYINEQHPHAWDFTDQNLAYEVLFGQHLVQDGIQARWLAPADFFLVFGAEAARGQNYPGSEAGGDRNGAGSRAVFAHLGDDLGYSHSWRAGMSYIDSSPKGRRSHGSDSNGIDAAFDFSGSSRTWIADLVWKWAPDGNARERNLKLQAEYFRRKEAGDLTCEDNTGLGGACGGTTDGYRATQSGYYAQAVYQFIPRWRGAYRYDRLDSGSVSAGANESSLAASGHQPSRHTVMMDFSPTEYSRLRLQVARDRSSQSGTETVTTLQYIMSIGPHGAHKF